jgi:hypothetical protein
VAAVRPVPWAELAGDAATVRRYRARVCDRGPGRCAYWTGAISDSGHGKIRAGSRSSETSRVVTAHQLGWAIAYGPQDLTTTTVVRHRCDEASCLLPEHWVLGVRADNIADYIGRRNVAGHPLGDSRGPAGRAVAIREAILTAAPGEVENAIAAAIAAGNPTGAQQEALW